MKYVNKSFTVLGCDPDAYDRIFKKRSSSSKDAREQDTRESPANKGEQRCPTRS